ncbi:MAG TPA: hypothetical protein ENN22_11830 [bacterium]|nr:hypothetical protein [bacterium]
MISYDLILSGGIAITAIIIFLLFQMSGLPRSGRRSILFVIGSAAAVLGISLFKQHRLKLLDQELKERENRLKQREENLTQLKADYQRSETELNVLKANLEQQLSAYRKIMLQIKAENQQEKKRIDQLSGEDLHNEFLAVFGE